MRDVGRNEGSLQHYVVEEHTVLGLTVDLATLIWSSLESVPSPRVFWESFQEYVMLRMGVILKNGKSDMD